jgi:septal ring-binding cell division protein DamX
MGSPTKGTIKEISFILLLEEVSESRLTGMLRIEKGPIIKVVYIQQGTIAFASSNEKSDRLTEVLKRAGKLTAEQIDDAQARLKPNVSLGKTLVELGYISPKDLLWGARSQVEGILHQLLFWKEGNYQILEGPLPKEIVSLGLQIPHVLYDGIQKTQDREWVLEQIVSPQAVVELTVDFHEKYASMKLPADPVVSRINGKRPLEDIAQSAGMDTFEVCKTVAALQLLGLAQRVQEQAVPVPAPVAPAQEETPKEALPGGLTEESGNLSLGQVLQMPTVEELEAEPEEETVESTMISPPPQGPLSGGEVVDSGFVHEDVPGSPAEAEDAEETVSFLESSSVKEMPSGPSLTFGAAKHRYPMGPRKTVNWRNLALWTGLGAILVLGGLQLYSTMGKKKHLEQIAKLTTPIKQTARHPAPKPPVTEPVAMQPVAETEPPAGDSAKEPVKTTQPPAQVQKPPVPATTQKTPLENTVQKPATPLQLLQSGKLTEAAAGWQKELARARSGYTIQLEIACQESTVREATGLVDSSKLLVVPINYHGQSCYRILYGKFTTQSSAEAARSGLPSIFLKQEAPARVVAVSKLMQ